MGRKMEEVIKRKVPDRTVAENRKKIGVAFSTQIAAVGKGSFGMTIHKG